MGGSPLENRLAEMEARLDFLTIRGSAHEWITEQLVANWLMHQADPEAFLDAISANDGRAWTNTQGISERPIPPREQQLYEQIGHIVEKIRKRVRQGYRKT